MRKTLRRSGSVLVSLLIGLLLVLLVFVLAFPSLKEWWIARHEGSGEAETRTVVPAELVGTDGLRLTPGVIETLGVRTVPVRKVEKGQTLELSGSLAPDTDRLVPMRSRFAGEVVEVGETHQGDPENLQSYRTLTSGDKVKKDQLLGVVWCKDLGEKKSELLDAVSHLTLDLETFNRYQKASRETGAIPERDIREAQRNVEADRIAISRAELTLRSWRLTDKEIEAIYKEAEAVLERVRKGQKGIDKEHETNWARVEIRAPFDATILERNVAVGAIIDTTTNLFILGDLTKLSLFVYAYEEDLPVLLNLPRPIPWTIRLKADTRGELLHGYVKEIRPFLDPTMHTALVRGEVRNPTGRMVSGQFITATIQLPPSPDEVEIPTAALIEDGHDSIVFVRDKTDKSLFNMRAVQVLRRTREKIYLRSQPQPQASARGCQPLLPEEEVVVGGSLELWSALSDQKAAKAAELNAKTTER